MADPIETFLAQTRLAVVGASRDRTKFGNIVFRDLRDNGYTVYPVNPGADEIEGAACYASLSELPEPVGGAVIVVPPRHTERVVREAAAAGIERVWMQEGAESDDALAFCEQNGITAVHGACIMISSANRA